MPACITLALYGSSEAQKNARSILENLPWVKRIDELGGMRLRLLIDSRITESSLIELLAPSGVSGFRLLKFTRFPGTARRCP